MENTFTMVLVSLFLSLLAIAHVVRGHSQSRRAKGSVITPAITDQINQILQNGTVPGYSVAIVHVGDGGGVEYGVWGNRTEDGDLVQPDVRMDHEPLLSGSDNQFN